LRQDLCPCILGYVVQLGGAIPLVPPFGERGQLVSQQSTNRSFDDLARALAEGSISRRGALKLFAGSALAALIPSRALAQSNRVTICHKPGTPDQKTMEVAQSAVEGHRRHGDREGPCGTTTTTSTSTSTSSTTSTTTSTTSTSTTPMCRPNGGTCSPGGTPCCSGTCNSNGFCCESGRVGVSNGTCALPCPSVGECPGFPFCACLNSTEGGFCAGSQSGNFCDPDLPGFCPSGELCSVGVCFTAC
jgi:hypothetical protein